MKISSSQRGTFIIFIANATTNYTLLTARWQLTPFDRCKSSVRQKLAAKVVKTELKWSFWLIKESTTFFPLCLLWFTVLKNSLNTQTRLIWMMTWSFNFSCAAAQHLDARILNSGKSVIFWVVGYFASFPIALVNFASWQCIISSPFSGPWLAIIHGIVQYCFCCFTSFPTAGPLSFAISFLPASPYFLFNLFVFFFASVQPYIKNVRSTSAIVCCRILISKICCNPRLHDLVLAGWPPCCATSSSLGARARHPCR